MIELNSFIAYLVHNLEIEKAFGNSYIDLDKLITILKKAQKENENNKGNTNRNARKNFVSNDRSPGAQ